MLNFVPEITIPTIPAPIPPMRTARPTIPPIKSPTVPVAPIPQVPDPWLDEPVKPFPITPGPFWETNPWGDTVPWRVENPLSQFWRGAVALDLPRRQRGEILYVDTTLEDLVALLLWSWAEDRRQ